MELYDVLEPVIIPAAAIDGQFHIKQHNISVYRLVDRSRNSYITVYYFSYRGRIGSPPDTGKEFRAEIIDFWKKLKDDVRRMLRTKSHVNVS